MGVFDNFGAALASLGNGHAASQYEMNQMLGQQQSAQLSQAAMQRLQMAQQRMTAMHERMDALLGMQPMPLGVETKPARCSYCGVRRAHDARRCDACGAPL